LIINAENGEESNRQEYYLEGFSLIERLRIIRQAKVDFIICCGISEMLFNMLESTNAKLICGIIGEVDEVFHAFVGGRLDEPLFHMPSHKSKE
jgi:hypothetical protein